MTSKVEMEDLSSGMTCFLFHEPQANWKKSWQGLAVGSMAPSRYEAGILKGSICLLHAPYFGKKLELGKRTLSRFQTRGRGAVQARE